MRDSEVRASIARRRRYGWIFAAVWSVYLIDPLREAWALEGAGARWYTVAVVVAFGVCYVGAFWLALRVPAPRLDRETGAGPDELSSSIVLQGVWPNPDIRLVVMPLAVLAALMAAAAVTLRFDALGLAVYPASFIAFVLPVRRAVPVLIGLILATTVVPQLAAGEEPAWASMQSIGLAAVAVGGIRQLIRRNQQLDQARRRLTELAIAEERLRVGRDVHDILGHSLTVITVKTELAQRLLELDPERARTEMADVERLARESLAGVRSTVGGLREMSLAGELANARTALRAAEIDAELPDSDDLPIRHSVVFGWVLREAVTNIVRHSGARHATVRVTPASIEVSDDGAGTADGIRFGSGLSGLRERVRATGGTLTVSNRPGGGLQVLASFPAASTRELE
ncbi:sensor histidine kinase [Nocardia sp. NPDC127526]|uniref:sensor histidine kinase n=1 Tax=Nocardia sp. NPDC127526 TaxID=3345393 RepID=UPI00362B7721